MRSINEGVLSVVGNTPLVLLARTYERTGSRLYAKLEGLNPGGSIKDRTALSILKHGIESGAIHPWTVVIESSSGNMGIGLAQACAYLQLRFICVVDPKTQSQNLNILRTYGAEIDMVTQPDPQTGEYLPVRIRRVKQLLASVRHGFWSSQYSNIHNAQAHHETMREIIAALEIDPDYLFVSTSTCGTLRGCAGYIREHKLRTRCIAVDALGSAIFGGGKAKRLIPGHGAAVIPPLFQTDLAERCLHVSDRDCIIGCRRLVREEAILAGGSSGGVFMAAEQAESFVEPGSICVAIFPDRGERYLNTIYSDEWVQKHFAGIEDALTPSVAPARELAFAG